MAFPWAFLSRCTLCLAGVLFGWQTANAQLDVNIGYLQFLVPPPPVLSNLESIPEDEGLAGANLAIKDVLTTGKFLKHNYVLNERREETEEAFLAAAKELLSISPYLVVHAPRDQLTKLANIAEANSALLFNGSAMDIELRSGACSTNLLHTIPSRAMLSDALAQFALQKRWKRWVLVSGNKPDDTAFADAIRRSAKKFQLKIEGEKVWKFDSDMRRNAAKEVPLFTQGFPDHDLLVIADEIRDFGRYVMYNTWLPRPVAGSEGVVPSAWSSSVEQHGAAQLQSRFRKLTDRQMTSIDYAIWAAVRTIGEAVTRTNSSDIAKVRAYILSDKFELGGFKGRKLTYRKWNGQLRQPIPLSHPAAVVAQAPLEGFLHRRNELDTLGLDKPESDCAAFGENQ